MLSDRADRLRWKTYAVPSMLCRVKRIPSLASLAALAALAAAPGSAVAATGANLLQNPGAESSAGATDGSIILPPVDWTVTGELTAIQYGASGGFPAYAPEGEVPKSLEGGVNFFAGGDAEVSTATQTVGVGASAAAIDAGTQTATLSGDLGGYSSQSDSAVITATYLSATGGALGSLTIGPITAAERDDHTTLLPKATSGLVPSGTRSIQVTMTSTRVEGEYNDGYADNLSLTLGAAAPPASPQAFGSAGVVSAPSNKVCLSHRAFTIHVRQLAGLTYKSVTVELNGHKLSVTRGAKITAPINLRGLPKGAYTIRITVLTTTGKKITGTRTYHTCRPHRATHGQPKL
jgi:hypothetical protein